MPLLSFMTDEVTALVPRIISDRGTNRLDYTAPLETAVISGCSLQPGAGTRDLLNNSSVQYAWTLYLPYDAPVNEQTGFLIDGRVFVPGSPVQVWKGPSPRTSYRVVGLLGWKG